VIIYNFHVIGISFVPGKADAPLIVNSDAVLSFSVPSQLFKPVTGRHPQALQRNGSVQHLQFDPRRPGNGTEFFYADIVKKLFRVFALEGSDHISMV
jgi:hypothetical protein